MKTQMAHWISAGAAAFALALGACGDERDRRDDETDTEDAGDSGTDAGGGTRFRDRDAALSGMDGTVEGGAGDGGSSGQGEGGATEDSGRGSTNPQGDAGPVGGDAAPSVDAGPVGEGGIQNPGGDSAAKAKDECEYQKKCDPVQFALEWDDDINQFCIPKRKAACEKNLPLTAPRAIGEGCHNWVRASCDNYRNFHYRVLDSNGKWQYGDAACEVTTRIQRENRAVNEDCTSDYQCKEGLFCRVEADDYLKHDNADVERICGKCATQYAYDGPNTSAGFYADENVCYRQEQCKAGYQCLRVYGTENDVFKSFDYSPSNVDLNHCVKTITKVGKDKPCARGSNVICDDGLVCKGDSEAAIVGTCVPAEGATIPTYVVKDARCNPAICDPRLHLECKPVKTASATEDRCVQKPVAAIGGYCKNDKQEDVASCSQYARCVDNTGVCVRRNVETESCFPTNATPSPYDRGSCDPNVYAEKPLVCRQDSGELAPKCHQALPQNMCSLPR